MRSRLLRRFRARARPSTIQSSARQRVLATYELLEHILEYLDPRSLRQARLVETYWQNIIQNSSRHTARLMQSDRPRQLHTVLVGVRGCGMNSLVNTFILGPTDSFPWADDPTWEPCFRRATIVDNERWMIDGSMDGYLDDRSHASFLGHTFRHSETYMLLYSMTSRESFDQLKVWLSSMESATEPLSMLIAKRATPNRSKSSDTGPKQCIPAALISTKNDLDSSRRAVSPAEGATLARELGCPFIETSAKTGAGVEQVFAEVCRTYKRVRLEEIRQRSIRLSLTKAVTPSDPEARERKERWWRWYRAKQRQG